MVEKRERERERERERDLSVGRQLSEDDELFGKKTS